MKNQEKKQKGRNTRKKKKRGGSDQEVVSLGNPSRFGIGKQGLVTNEDYQI